LKGAGLIDVCGRCFRSACSAARRTPAIGKQLFNFDLQSQSLSVDNVATLAILIVTGTTDIKRFTDSLNRSPKQLKHEDQACWDKIISQKFPEQRITRALPAPEKRGG
jgi:hypothetical protein